MKKSKEKVYDELRKNHSDEELADSYIFSVELSETEQREANEEFLKLRFERLKNMSEGELIFSDLFAFKLKLQQYFKQRKFDADYSFSRQLKEYIKISRRSNAEIAKNLGLHKTKLSRLINDRDKPNVDIMYRLEEHSDREVPAFYWWRLYSRELEHKIRTDFEKKRSEAEKVDNPLDLRA